MTTASPIPDSTQPGPGAADSGSAAQRDRRKRILDATYALAREGGYDAVQMRAVAEKGEVALGTLYRYFPSKVHLLVAALGEQFAEAEARLNAREIPGDSSAERVLYVLKRLTRGMQGDARLTEALTRAFMFADSSVADGIHTVGMSMTSIVTHAMHGGVPDEDSITEQDIAIARVIGDVWLSALVSWVTGRSTAEETAAHMENAVRLVLRD